MSHNKALIPAICFFAALMPMLSQAQTSPSHRKSEDRNAMPAKAADPARGERVFQQNCSRCHNAPQGFPPHISGTILRHMRVRALLSEADEKALLRFMNP